MTDRDDAPTRKLAATPPGTLARIGPYRITGVLGRGGFGVVYAGERDGRACAIKVLAAELAGDPDLVRRFARETEVLQLIDHPNIVATFDHGHLDDGRPYFVMDRADGTGLHQLIATRGPLALADAIAILAPVCDALDAAHGCGVVHRDLKPGNILVAARGNGWDVKLADFGIAKVLATAAGATALTVAGQRLGTPETMAPEQIGGGEVDVRADVYALGVVLFYTLAGRYPYVAADPAEIEHLHLTATPPALVPPRPAIDAVIAHAMARRAARRPTSAGAVLAALRAAAAGDDAHGSAPARAAAADPPATRRPAAEPLGLIMVAGAEPAGLDSARLAAVMPTTDVRVHELADGRAACLIRAIGAGTDRGALAMRIVAVALRVRADLPGAAIAAGLAGTATELHVAYNRTARAAPPTARGEIALDDELARLLAGDGRIETIIAGPVLVPR